MEQNVMDKFKSKIERFGESQTEDLERVYH